MYQILPMVLSAGFLFDALKPARYWIEKKVVDKSVPSVVGISKRKKLQDFATSDNTKTTTTTTTAAAAAATAVFDHSLWDALLKEYIVTTDGTIGDVQGIHLFNYQGLVQEPRLEEYLSQLERAQPKSLAEPEQLAFWINAYNALCISLIVQDLKKKKQSAAAAAATDNDKELVQPVKSINDLSVKASSKRNEKDTAVWDLPAGTVGGQRVSLNHVEHVELRQAWDEPAIHACIVCASASCPNLRQEAFTGTQIEQQLKDQVQGWMQNPTKGLAVATRSKCGAFDRNQQLTLSRIFLWFGDDFGGWRGLQKWLPKYIIADEEAKTLIKSGKVSLRYFDYNWELNGAPNTHQ